MGLEEDIVNAPDNGTIAEIREDLDRAENAESGDITLTGDPPEEPVTNPLERVTDPMGNVTYAIARLIVSSDDAAEVFRNITKLLDYERQNSQIKNLQETIRVMRAESTKMRTESDAAIEGSLAKLLECVVDHVDLMMDPISTDSAKFDAGQAAKRLCLGLIHLAHLSALVEPQSQAMAAGLKAVDRATEAPTDQVFVDNEYFASEGNNFAPPQPTSETPTDADKA